MILGTETQRTSIVEQFAKAKSRAYHLNHRIKIGKPPVKNEFGIFPQNLKLIEMTADGKSLKEMSQETGVSISGIVHRLRRLSDKFECRTKTQLIAVCFRKGILKINEPVQV